MMIKNERGFTLIEILITSIIFAVIMAAVFSGFRGGIFGYRNINENLEAYQAARSIFARINTDLRNSFSYKDKDGNSCFSGTRDKIGFLSLVDSFSPGGRRRDFAFVSYWSREGSLLRLVRSNVSALDDDCDVEPEEFAQKADVRFQYGSMSGQGQEIVFKDSWGIDSDEEKEILPQAVRISLKVKGKTEYSFDRTVYLVAVQ